MTERDHIVLLVAAQIKGSNPDANAEQYIDQALAILKKIEERERHGNKL